MPALSAGKQVRVGGPENLINGENEKGSESNAIVHGQTLCRVHFQDSDSSHVQSTTHH